jgi:hypothetical protein
MYRSTTQGFTSFLSSNPQAKSSFAVLPSISTILMNKKRLPLSKQPFAVGDAAIASMIVKTLQSEATGRCNYQFSKKSDT